MASPLQVLEDQRGSSLLSSLLGLLITVDGFLKYGFTFIDLLDHPKSSLQHVRSVPQPRIEPWPPALGAHSLNHQSNSYGGYI